MTIVKHELRQGKTAFCIWTASIGFLLAVCIFLFPEMKEEMGGVGALFSSMGAFTKAFGMDKLNFGTLTGYYAIECGNVLGLGGAFFASLCAAGMLSKEERDRTAEFLLTHPVSRARIVTEKLTAVFLELTGMNLLLYGLAVGSIALIGETIPWKTLNLLHLGFYLLQLELAGLCFGLSAFLRKSSAGAGLGVAVVMYFLNLVANIAKSAKFLKYFTPYGFCDAADIVSRGRLDPVMVAIGLTAGAVGILAAYVQYGRKDIR